VNTHYTGTARDISIAFPTLTSKSRRWEKVLEELRVLGHCMRSGDASLYKGTIPEVRDRGAVVPLQHFHALKSASMYLTSSLRNTKGLSVGNEKRLQTLSHRLQWLVANTKAPSIASKSKRILLC
jgi:hypothetical protein